MNPNKNTQNLDEITSSSIVTNNITVTSDVTLSGIFNEKGDILSTTDGDTIAALEVGSDNQYMAANSSTPTGLEWKNPSWVEAITSFDQEMPRFVGTTGQLQGSGITVGGAPSISVYGGSGVLGANVDSSTNRWSRLDIANIRCYNSSFYTTITRQPGGDANWTYGIPGTTPVTGNAIRWGASSNEWFTPCAASASATDNSIVRFDGTTGRAIQNSSVQITDGGNLIPTATTQNCGLSTNIWNSMASKRYGIHDSNGLNVLGLYKSNSGSAYDLYFPADIGTTGQSLRYTGSGGVLEWYDPTTSGSIDPLTITATSGSEVTYLRRAAGGSTYTITLPNTNADIGDIMVKTGPGDWDYIPNAPNQAFVSTYTPTEISTNNCDVTAISVSKISRISGRVTVFGRLIYIPDTDVGVYCQITLSLPTDADYAPGSNFTATTDIIGTGSFLSGLGNTAASNGCRIDAVIGSKNFVVDMIIDPVTNTDTVYLGYSFTYDV